MAVFFQNCTHGKKIPCLFFSDHILHSTNNFHVEPSAELPFLHRVKKAIFGYNDPLTCNFAIDEESLFFPLGSNKNLWIYHFY